jgi:hypothetical protein
VRAVCRGPLTRGSRHCAQIIQGLFSRDPASKIKPSRTCALRYGHTSSPTGSRYPKLAVGRSSRMAHTPGTEREVVVWRDWPLEPRRKPLRRESTIASPPLVAVSVTSGSGEPITGLSASDFRVEAIVVAPGGSDVGVVDLSSRALPGFYLLRVGPHEPQTWKSGVYLFGILVETEDGRGQALARALLDFPLSRTSEAMRARVSAKECVSTII